MLKDNIWIVTNWSFIEASTICIHWYKLHILLILFWPWIANNQGNNIEPRKTEKKNAILKTLEAFYQMIKGACIGHTLIIIIN